MGPIHAKDLLLFGKTLTAEQAEQRGLVTQVIDKNLFEEEKDKICEKILSLPKGSLLANKSIIQKWNKDKLHQINAEEVELLKQRWLTEEFVQAMMEFIRQRKNKWQMRTFFSSNRFSCNNFAWFSDGNSCLVKANKFV